MPIPTPSKLLATALTRFLGRCDNQITARRLRQYRELVESSEDQMAIADADYRYLLVNQAYADMFGRARAEIEGARIPEILGQDYFERVLKPKLDDCLAGHTQRFETERLNLDGKPRQLLARYFPLDAPAASTRQIVAVITDISEFKRVEIKLGEQSRLLDIAGRVGRIGGWWADLATNQVQWSEIVAEIHGMPKGFSPTLEEGIAFYAPQDLATIRRVFNACAKRGVPYREDLRIINAQGEQVWVRTSGEAVHDEHGRICAVQGAFQDISARKAAEQQVQALSERLQTTLESITDGFYTLDRDWHFTYLNQEAARLLQQPREQLLGKPFWQCLPEAIGTRIERAYRRAMIVQETVTLEEYYRPFSTWFEIRVFPSQGGLAVYFQDVTEQHRMLRKLQAQKAALRQSRDQLAELVQMRKALIDSLPAHIALLDADGRVVEVNDAWRRFAAQNEFPDASAGTGMNYIAVCQQASGDASEEAPSIARGLQALLAGELESFALEYPCHAPHEQRWFRMAANRLRHNRDVPRTTGNETGSASDHEPGQEPGHEPARDGGAVVMHIDITERKLAELQLNQLMHRDRLTNLLTRDGFTEALAKRLGEHDQHPESTLLALFDIKDLRAVNDSHGFETGDRLLIEIARWLERQAGSRGLVGRIAGDEFSIFLRGEPGLDPSQQVEAINAITEQCFLLPTIGIEIDIDLGYTLVGAQRCSAETLLHQAELALFQKRQQGTESAVAYNADLDRQVHERIALTRDLRTALYEEQFELHFQPKVDLKTGALVACEALLRWQHPQRGLQPPGLFIPIAEQSQLIVAIGDWVLHEACRLLRAWQDAGLNVVSIAVNVSLLQFRADDFPQAVRATLRHFEIEPGALTLEITESVFAEASETLLEHLNALRALGIRLSLDDFGTGYSSLAYLQRYPFDEIKVDRCFVARVLDDRYSRTVLEAIKGIADALGAELIAEGIESEPVRQALIDLGYQFAQGYLFSVPLETEDFRWLLEQGSRLPLQISGASASRPPATNIDQSEASA
ncbi:MAG: EAL domain-containing protein [Halochromatium sp.]|uniref:EAL domain-containing protein n=1 Tax=Halochromatium sp. TaxID=2049430 RepID=UPI0039793FE0